MAIVAIRKDCSRRGERLRGTAISWLVDDVDVELNLLRAATLSSSPANSEACNARSLRLLGMVRAMGKPMSFLGELWHATDRRAYVLIFVITSVLFGAGMTITAVVIAGRYSSALTAPAVAGGVVSGLLFGAVMTAAVSVLGRRQGGLSTARILQKSLKTGALPNEVNMSEWEVLLRKQERDALRGRWLYPVFFAVATGLYSLVAFSGSFPDLGLLPWFGVFFFAGVGIYAPFETNRSLARIRRLQSVIHDTARQP